MYILQKVFINFILNKYRKSNQTEKNIALKIIIYFTQTRLFDNLDISLLT